MANKTIKGLTVEIGGDTTKLGKALEKVEKKSGDLSSELGQINKLLKLDPTNTELLAQKQKVLADAVENTEEKLDTLKEAEKQVQKQFEKGEASEAQVRALQREIIATEKKLNSYKGAVKETADAVQKMGDNADKAGDDVKDLGEKSDKAEKEADDLGGTLDGSLSNGLKAVTALAASAAAAIIGTVEATQEYRNAMGRLDTAFAAAEHNQEAAKKTYKELQGILGDTDTAVEASTLLAQFCDTEEELAEMTNTLAGVYARFPDSLPVEALVESANETARTGQIAGNLADALNWAAAEGETFGVTTKQNIEFTKLEKKQLDALTDAQRAEYEARKEQYETIEEYNKGVEEAASAEDLFNIALSNCANEQERQQLIMSTLNRIYGNAGTQYKKTNKAVIEANEANEEWNATMAEVGEEMQPVVTEIKKFGTSLLKDAKEPMKDAAEFISDDLLPALLKTGNWVKKNGPFIKNTAIGITTTLVAYKTACVATEIAHKGLKGAIMGTTVAQKALNLAQAASPIGLVVTALVGATGLITALQLYQDRAEFAAEKVDVLTEEEKKLTEAAGKAAEAFREQRAATEEAVNGIMSEMKYVEGLARELKTLADASGNVKKEDEARVKFILNELKEATGEEYLLIDGTIEKYDQLTESVYKTIEAKKANLLLEAYGEQYVQALKNKDQAYTDLMLKEEQYLAQLDATTKKEEEYTNKRKHLEEQLTIAKESNNLVWQGILGIRIGALEEEWLEEKAILDDTKQEYDTAQANFGNYYKTINDYETAQTAILEGNYDKAVGILTKKGEAYGVLAEGVDEETGKVLNTLHQEAVEAGLKAELTKTNFENGVAGFTEQMVKDAETDYAKAMGKFADAYADAKGVGEDLGGGLKDGMENERSGLLAKARSLVSGIISAMRKEADSHSPAQKTIDFGEDLGEGAEIGIERKTKDVAKAGERQAAAVINAYTDQEVAGQNALRGVAEQQAARQASTQMMVAASNAPTLEKILTAIEKGQVLTIDGDTLVGATAQRMDNALGQRRSLAARGALK